MVLDPQYQEGDVARMPWPEISAALADNLGANGMETFALVRELASYNEVDHAFVRLIDLKEVALAHQRAEEAIRRNEENADVCLSSLLGLDEQDHKFIRQEIIPRWNLRRTANWFVPDHVDRLQYLVGLIFGRWDIRIALDPSLAAKMPDPFAPLPICPPGMLLDADSWCFESRRIVSEKELLAHLDASTLPLEGSVKNPTIPDDGYPLRINWDGILVDDLGFESGLPHRDGIGRRVHEVIDLLWKDKAHEIEQEACEILGFSNLHEWFRRPSGFFQNHLKCYSKSRRKAPIYWPLSTASGSYTIWLYYHRLTDQTIYTVVNNYVEQKISKVEKAIARIEDELTMASSAYAAGLRDRLDEGRTFVGELRDLRDELLRIAALPFKPNLNDGVIINAAPFHKLFRLRSWAKDTEDCWRKLEKGEYDWAHLAYNIWPDRVREVCRKDHSVAIAHGLEDLCEVKNQGLRKKSATSRRKKGSER